METSNNRTFHFRADGAQIQALRGLALHESVRRGVPVNWSQLVREAIERMVKYGLPREVQACELF